LEVDPTGQAAYLKKEISVASFYLNIL